MRNVSTGASSSFLPSPLPLCAPRWLSLATRCGVARVFAALAISLTVLLAGLIARDMGGGRSAQLLSAAAAFASVVSLMMGSVTLYASFDYFWWVAAVWALVRRVRSDDARWWLAVGLFVGLGLMTKYTMVLLGASMLAAVLLSGNLRRDLRTPWPWLGAATALIIVAPNLVWQAQHGWVALEFTASIHQRDVAWGRAQGYWVEQLYANASPFALPLWIAGLIWLLVARRARPWRFLAWLYLLPLLAFGLLQGRSYYMGAPYVWLCAAGAVAWEAGIAWLEGGWRKVALWGTGLWAATAIIVGAVLVVPWAPVNSPMWRLTASLTDVYREEFIWPELTQAVADVYNELPLETRAATTILAGNYGEAGALNRYGPALGLPRTISGTNNYWLWGWGDPAAPPQHVILVGWTPEYMRRFFSGCAVAGTVANPQAIENEETKWHRYIYYCSAVDEPWETLWPQIQSFGKVTGRPAFRARCGRTRASDCLST